uniref:Uncharacterized protein n=1 Tax=Aegilops tauschii subsp. strangulata TaxID=200361 RepID=A0A453PV96_AEGTS
RPQILCVSFNQDNSMFSVGTKEGFKIFDARTGRLCNDNSKACFRALPLIAVVHCEYPIVLRSWNKLIV